MTPDGLPPNDLTLASQMHTGVRVRLHSADPVRRRGLAALLEAAGHELVDEAPDVELCDVGQPGLREAEAPVLALGVPNLGVPNLGVPSLGLSALGTLTLGAPAGSAAGWLAADVAPHQLDLALRAVAAGLQVRSPGMAAARGFAPVEDLPLLTPREREVLGLIGEGLSNKEMARRLGISVHTVKFHMEALFSKLEVTSRAEAVAKGLRGGVIEL